MFWKKIYKNARRSAICHLVLNSLLKRILLLQHLFLHQHSTIYRHSLFFHQRVTLSGSPQPCRVCAGNVPERYWNNIKESVIEANDLFKFCFVLFFNMKGNHKCILDLFPKSITLSPSDKNCRNEGWREKLELRGFMWEQKILMIPWMSMRRKDVKKEKNN